MDSFYIDIEEANVQKIINDVKIVEERFNENFQVKLNDNELLIEITNLIMDFTNNPNAEYVEKKTNIFKALIDQSNKNDNLTIDTLSMLKPIITVAKELILIEDDEEQDEEYENQNVVKMTKQSALLKQFADLSQNMRM